MTDTASATVQPSQLRSIVERIERLIADKDEVAEAIKEVYAEAKGNGFDMKTLRKVIAERQKSTEDRDNEKAMLDLYLQSLGMEA